MATANKRPPYPWTAEQDKYLADAIKTTTYKDMTAYIIETYNANITVDMVKRRCFKLGLRTGRDTRLKKGLTPYYKGKQFRYHSEEAKQRSRANCFKPGQMPKNYMPGIGRERKTTDGYTLVRISDIRGIEPRFNWKLKQRVVWEQANGPIPDGWKVVFLDGSKDNFDLDNLRCIPQGALSIFNRKYGYAGDPQLNALNLRLAELEYKANKRKKEQKEK